MKKAKLAKITLDDLLKERPNACERCGRKDMLTIDHVVPIDMLKSMGFTTEEMFADKDNLALLCRPCNALKAWHLDFGDPRTKSVLLKYLARL